MQISIETMSGLERRLTISVPSETFEAQISERLGDAANRVRLPGFRPGKVPLKEVRRRYGQAVRAEVAGELMQSSFVDAVRQEELAPAGQPNLEVVKMDPGADFEFTATFEVFPAVEVVDLGKLAVKRPEGEISDADLDDMVERLRDQHKEWVPVTRAAADGDQVTVDFEGRLDGEVFEGGKAEDARFVVGAGQMIEAFDAGIRGLAADQSGEFDATFPDDYRAENLAGKTVTFAVTVKSVEEPRLPELDDEFFRNFGVEEGGLDAFRSEVRSNMQREMDAAIRKTLKSQVMDQLGALHEIQLPEALIQNEIGALREQMLQQFNMYGGGNQPDLPAELFRDQARQRVTVGLVVNEIVSAAGIEVDAPTLRARVEEMAAGYAEPQQVVNWYYSNQEQLHQVEMAVLEDLVVDHVLERASVETVTSSYRDIVAGQAVQEAAADEAAGDSDTDAPGAGAGTDAADDAGQDPTESTA